MICGEVTRRLLDGSREEVCPSCLHLSPTSLTALCPGKCWKFLEVLESCGAAGGTSWLCGKRRAMGDSYCKPESSCLFLSDQHVIFTSRQSSWSHPSRLESLHPKITLGFICSVLFPSFPALSPDAPPPSPIPLFSGRPENLHTGVLPDDSSQRLSFERQVRSFHFPTKFAGL